MSDIRLDERYGHQNVSRDAFLLNPTIVVMQKGIVEAESPLSAIDGFTSGLPAASLPVGGRLETDGPAISLQCFSGYHTCFSWRQRESLELR